MTRAPRFNAGGEDVDFGEAGTNNSDLSLSNCRRFLERYVFISHRYLLSFYHFCPIKSNKVKINSLLLCAIIFVHDLM